MRLRLLDRYVLSELLYPFIFGTVSYTHLTLPTN